MKSLVSVLSTALLSGLAASADACTDFRLTASDGTIIVARSMEFAVDLQSNIRNQPRQKNFATTAPDGKAGLAWTSKYGYLFVDGMNSGLATDGMNEKGLSFEALYLPGDAQYQTVPASKDAAGLPYMYLGDWVLGNFQSVDEVREALPGVYVFGQTIPQAGSMIFPLHFAIYDSTGKGIVVEYTKKGMQIYNNDVGILTNSPTYDWHITNLANYLNLSPYSPSPITEGGMTFSSIGQGAGSFGLPGDISPPSRFVKTAFLKRNVVPGADVKATVNLAEHIINNVDIPLGSVRTKRPDGQDSLEFTQWVVIKDLTHHVLYYRGYSDLTLRSIAMDKIDFSANAPVLKMPINNIGYTVVDATSQFLGQKTG